MQELLANLQRSVAQVEFNVDVSDWSPPVPAAESGTAAAAAPASAAANTAGGDRVAAAATDAVAMYRAALEAMQADQQTAKAEGAVSSDDLYAQSVASAFVEQQLAKQHAVGWRHRGPRDDTAPRVWKNQLWREGSERYANRGGKRSAEWTAFYRGEGPRPQKRPASSQGSDGLDAGHGSTMDEQTRGNMQADSHGGTMDDQTRGNMQANSAWQADSSSTLLAACCFKSAVFHVYVGLMLRVCVSSLVTLASETKAASLTLPDTEAASLTLPEAASFTGFQVSSSGSPMSSGRSFEQNDTIAAVSHRF